MTISGDAQPDRTPYDAGGRVEVGGARGWKYLPIETAAGDEAAITVTAEGPGGATVSFIVPTYVSQGEELGEITRLVIRARERMDRSAGLGS
jgi:hypothetical protein